MKNCTCYRMRDAQKFYNLQLPLTEHFCSTLWRLEKIQKTNK